jgi:4-hydroxy-tetrahydrodipicolinate reductase
VLTPMRIAIIGNGKMGKAVAALAAERGHTVHTVVTGLENAGGKALTSERLKGVDVAIEFTRPDAAVANLERLIGLGIPTVTGTTGWTESLPRLSELVRQRAGALLHAANFSVGVTLFFRVARDLARSFRGRSEFAVSIHEEHHKTKLDSPSGTALLLQRQLWNEEPGRRFPITSVRAGDALGTHAVSYTAPHETVTLTHVTRSREVFATGALAAAEWLPGRTGVFTFDQMLFGEPG